MQRLSIFLIVAAFIAGMGGCDGTATAKIRTWYDLDAVRNNLTSNYILMNDLNSTTPGYEELAGPTANQGKGWEPIRTSIPICSCASLTGTFDGQGYEIHDLYINRPDEDYVGLFGVAYGYGVVQNVGLVNVTVTGNNSVGGLAGAGPTVVNNCHSTGSVTGNKYVGGLAGVSVSVINSYSAGDVTGIEDVGGLLGYIGGGVTVSNSHATSSVTGSSSVGGLVGKNSGGTMSNSYASGNVTGQNYVGGLVGGNNGGTVSNSYATSSVTGTYHVGGLVGWNVGDVGGSYSTGGVTGNNWVGGLVGSNYDSNVRTSYSTSSVSGHEYVGGLVGKNARSFTIVNGELLDWRVSDSYASGSVTGNSYVGGLVGQNQGVNMGEEYLFVLVSNSYSTGNVTGNSSVGGLVGWTYYSAVSNSFWDMETSGQAVSNGGTGKNATEMHDIVTFSGADWNIIAAALNETNPSYIWNIVDNVTYPFLSWQP